MGFRRLLRRVLKPAAMLLIVGGLALSLIVTTPSTAQALTARDVKAAETFVMGATKTLAPAATVALTVASVTPVGFALRMLSLGISLYSARDLWMPVVAGTFGAPQTEGPDSAPGTPPAGMTKGTPSPEIKLSNARIGAADQILVSASAFPNSTGGFASWHVAYRLTCNYQGTVKVDSGYRLNSSTAIPYSSNLSFRCQYSQGGTIYTGVPTGLRAGLAGGGGNLPNMSSGDAKPLGPSNYVVWGGEAPGGFDPFGADVKYKVKSDCIDPAGTISTIEAESSGDMLRFPSCEAAGKGHGTGKTKVTGLAPGTTVEQPLWDSPVAPSDPSTPLCDAARPSGGCELSVELDSKPCTAGNVECENWSELQQNDPNNTRLKCRFGPYTLPMSQCAMLEKAYLPGGAALTSPNTDGNPGTSGGTNPNGSQLAPQTPTQTAPATGLVPGGAGQPAAGSEPQAAACFPTGWGMLNPFEWVYKPTVCAMRAMFEPSKSIQTRVTSMQGAFSNKVPVSWFGAASVGGVSGGGCPTNWAIQVQGQSYSLICGTPADGIIQGFRPVLGAMLIVAMLWPLIRSLFYAAIPVFKVTPS